MAFAEMLGDLRPAWRTLVRTPAFSIGSVVMMAGALGVSAAAFGVLSAVVPTARALPGGERVVNISPLEQGQVLTDMGLTPERAEALRTAGLNSLETIVDVNRVRTVVSSSTASQPALMEAVHGDYFGLFGVTMVHGRALTSSEARGASDDVAVVSSRLASQLFGQVERAVGSVVRVSGKPFVVVGVAPAQFRGLSVPTLLGTDLWVAREAVRSVTGSSMLKTGVFAKLRVGADVRSARSEVRALDLGVVPAAAATMPTMLAAVVWSSGSAILLVTVALVTVASANLACLMMARVNSRATEVAIRVTLGASRWRVMRLLLSESVLLVAVATALGGLLAHALVVAFAHVSWAERSGMVLVGNVVPDWRLYAYVVSCGLTAAIVTGLWSARRAVLVDPARSLLSSTGSTTTGRQGRGSTALVAIQLAVSTVLLFGAALAAWNGQTGLRTDAGIDTTHTVIGRVDYGLQGIDEALRRPTNALLLESAAAVPGVRAAALITGLPIGRDGAFAFIPGLGGTRLVHVAGDAFGVLGIPIRGRAFDIGDQAGTPSVAIVSEALAADLWLGEQALGQTLTLRVAGRNRFLRVVGVASDTDTGAVVSERRRTVYVPLAQDGSAKVAVVVTGRGSASSVVAPMRTAMRSGVPAVAVFDLRPVTEELGLVTQGFRLASALLVSTGGFALLVTWIGLYAVTAYLVSRRLREFGLMRALGARDRDLYRSVVTPVLRTVGIGAGSGMLISVGLSGVARHYLVGFGTAGWALVVAVPGVLCGVVLIAALIPAWRATRLQPLGLLRQT